MVELVGIDTPQWIEIQLADSIIRFFVRESHDPDGPLIEAEWQGAAKDSTAHPGDSLTDHLPETIHGATTQAARSSFEL
jgi:hypothetical protein